MDVIQLARKLVSTTPAKILQKAIDRPEVKDAIIELNTEIQLGQLNEDSTGKKLYQIGGEYSSYTQKKKGLSGKSVNLNDTDAYWDSYRVVPLGSGNYAIDSNPTIHGDNLEDRYGDKLEGLNKENEIIAKKLIEKTYIKDLLR